MSLGSILWNVGVVGTDLSDVVTSWLSPQTPLGVLHKFISFLFNVFLHLDMLWIGMWHHP